MSILLEALKNKSTASTQKAAAKSKSIEPKFSLVSEEELAREPSQDPMQSVVSALHIEKPAQLDWQLSLSTDKESLAPTEAPTLAPLEPLFTIALPTLDLPVTESPSVVTTALPLVAESTTEKPPPGLLDVLSQKPILTQTPTTVAVSNETPLALTNNTAENVSNHQEKPQLVVEKSSPMPEATEAVVAPQGATHGLSDLLAVKGDLPPVQSHLMDEPSVQPNLFDNAKNFVSLNQQEFQVPQSVPQLDLKPKGMSSKQWLSLGGLLSVGVIAYMGYWLWSDEQAMHQNNMANYQLPDSTVVAPEEQSMSAAEESSASALPAPVESAMNKPEPVHEKKKVEPPKKQTNLSEARRVEVVDQRYSPIRGDDHVSSKSFSIQDRLESAWNAWQMGDIALSEKNYRQVLEKQPTNRDALIGMMALSQLNPAHANRAKEVALRLTELYPNDKEVRSLVAPVLSTGNDVNHQISQLRSQIKEQPNQASAHYQLGVVFSEQQRWAEAQASFFTAASLDNKAEYFANLGICYDQLGKKELAIGAYQQALDLAQTRATLINQSQIADRLQFLSSTP